MVAVPENRQLATLALLFANRGARVVEVPLVDIWDAPDPAPVLAWIRRFIAEPPALLVLLTGEGLRRLLTLAATHALEKDFVMALRGVPCLCRGPKPEQVLMTLDMHAAYKATVPTTDGVITTLTAQDLREQRVGVQLYGEEPNVKLQEFLTAQGAIPDVVAPYVYANKVEETKVLDFIVALEAGQIDVIAFTSQSQFKRLHDVASSNQMLDQLNKGLRATTLAVVGPVVKQQLEAAGYKVAIMPERVYFMKPLVAAVERYFESTTQAHL